MSPGVGLQHRALNLSVWVLSPVTFVFVDGPRAEQNLAECDLRIRSEHHISHTIASSYILGC